MILDLTYISGDLFISNQVKYKTIYSLLGLNVTSLNIKNLFYLINILNSIKSIIGSMTLGKLTFTQKRSSSCV